MEGRQGSWVVSIAGLGSASSASITPLGFCEPHAPGLYRGDAFSVFEDAYVPVLRNITITRVGVRPLSGDARSGALEFDLDLNDDLCPEVAKFFFATRASRTPAANLRLNTQMNPSAVAIPTDDAPVPEFEIAYIGREAFRVTGPPAGSPLAVPIVDRVPNADGTPGSRNRSLLQAGEIGHIGTIAEVHRGQSETVLEEPFREDRIWSSNPAVKGREVILYWTDYDDGTETIFGRYHIWQAPVLSNDGLRVRVSCADAISMLGERDLNWRANRYTISRARGFDPSPFNPLATLHFDLQASGKKLAEADRDRPWGDFFVLSAERSAIIGGLSLSGDGYAYDGDQRSWWLSRSVPTDPSRWEGKVAYDLLVSDPLDGTTPTGARLADPTTHPYYSTELGRIASHPFEMLLQHIRQIDSNLPDHWRVDLPQGWVDTEGILRLRDGRFGWASPWPGLVAGKDGKAVRAKTFLETEFLRPLSASLAINEVGQLTVKSISVYESLAPLTPTHILPGRGAQSDFDLVSDYVTVRLGIGLGGEDDAHRITADDGYQGTFVPYGKSSLSWDIPGLLHPDQPYGLSAADEMRILEVRSLVSAIAQMWRFPIVRYMVYVTGRQRVHAGDFRRFTAPAFRSAMTGLMPPNATNGTFVGYILEAGMNANSWEQDLVVLQMPWDENFISWGATVEAYNSGTKRLTVTEVQFIKPIDGDGRYVVGDLAFEADAETVIVGSVCVIMDEAGDPKTDPFVIASIVDATTIEAVDPIVLVGTSDAYVWAEGDELESVDYDEARVEETAEFAFIEEVYAYAV